VWAAQNEKKRPEPITRSCGHARDKNEADSTFIKVILL